MINIKGTKDYMIALESVAMTDIVLNMFIFFFISFSILYTFNPNRMAKLEINLPKAQSAVRLEGEEKVIISISKAGVYFIGEEKVAQKDLKDVLQRKVKDNRGASVLLRVDNLAKFSDVARALDVINELNIKRVSVATIKKDM